MGFQNRSISYDQAIENVAQNAFKDVIPRFQTIGTDKSIAKGRFYDVDFGKKMILKDSIFSLSENNKEELLEEIDSRWALLEGAFSINQEQYHLANDIRQIYIEKGYDRKNLTSNIPFLNGYQSNICFYWNGWRCIF